MTSWIYLAVVDGMSGILAFQWTCARPRYQRRMRSITIAVSRAARPESSLSYGEALAVLPCD